MGLDADTLPAVLGQVRDRFRAERGRLSAEHPGWKPEVDARLAAFDAIAEALDHARTALALARLQAPATAEPTVLAAKEPDLAGFDRFIRTACLAAVVDGAEVFFRSVIRALMPGACLGGAGEFKGVYDAVLARIRRRRWTPLLDLLRVLRNTAHNQGVYQYKHPRDHAVAWRGRVYRLIHGQPVDFLSWPLLMELAVDLVGLLGDVARTPRIAGLDRVPMPGLQPNSPTIQPDR